MGRKGKFKVLKPVSRKRKIDAVAAADSVDERILGAVESAAEKSEEYVSESTIDNPPREEKEPEGEPEEQPKAGQVMSASFDDNGQAVIAGAQPLPEVIRPETSLLTQFPEMFRKIKFKMTLSLDNCAIKVLEGEVEANRIEECLIESLQSEVFLRMLRASVGRPMNAGAVGGDISVRLMTQKTISAIYQRALEYLARRVPGNPETYTMAELERIFGEMRQEAERATTEARALLAGVEPVFSAPVDTRTPAEKAEAAAAPAPETESQPAPPVEPEADPEAPEAPTLPQEPQSLESEGSELKDDENF